MALVQPMSFTMSPCDLRAAVNIIDSMTTMKRTLQMTSMWAAPQTEQAHSEGGLRTSMAIIMLRKAVNSSGLKPIKTTAYRLPATHERRRDQHLDHYSYEAKFDVRKAGMRNGAATAHQLSESVIGGAAQTLRAVGIQADELRAVGVVARNVAVHLIGQAATPFCSSHGTLCARSRCSLRPGKQSCETAVAHPTRGGGEPRGMLC